MPEPKCSGVYFYKRSHRSLSTGWVLLGLEEKRMNSMAEKTTSMRARVSRRQKSEKKQEASTSAYPKLPWRVLANFLDIEGRLPENLKDFWKKNTTTI